MSINFPSDRDEAGLGTGPLEDGDEWSYNNIDYTYAFSPNNTGLWSAKIAATPASVAAGDGIRITTGNTINVDSDVARELQPNELTGQFSSGYLATPFGDYIKVARADQTLGVLRIYQDNTLAGTFRGGEDANVYLTGGSGEQTLQSVLNKGFTAEQGNGNTGVIQLSSQSPQGTNRIILSTGEGSIELAKASGAPYIDFKTNINTDFDCRVQQEANGNLLFTSKNGGVFVDDSVNGRFQIRPPGTGGDNDYELLPATSNRLGGIKVGSGLSVTNEGVLSATGGGGGGSDYTLPAASASTRGGIRVGSGLAISSGDILSAEVYDSGVYSIKDPIFGGIYQGSWSRAFNNALQQRVQTGSFYNGMIDTLLVPVGVYDCTTAIRRTKTVKIIGDQNGSVISMGDAPPHTVNVDGTIASGQFCLENKGALVALRFTGTVTNGSSLVLALRTHDNDGVPFGILRGAQNDSADMDMPIVQCSFKAAKFGGDTDGLLKYVGRNAYIFGCAFNTNGTALHLSFPNKPGSTTAGDSCDGNNSLANDSQGGTYGWRRCQVIGCYFHMQEQSTCIVVRGKYQCRGLIIANNLTDIGGRLLKVVPDAPEAGNYSNGKGGGLTQASITGNTALNQNGNASHILFATGDGAGYYENNSIIGNSFGGSDETYLSGCVSEDKIKRCANGIKIDGGAVVKGLSISGNSLGYYLKSAIEITGQNKTGIAITGNNILNACIDEDGGHAIDVNNSTTGTCIGNTYVRDISAATTSGFRGSSLVGIDTLNSYTDLV